MVSQSAGSPQTPEAMGVTALHTEENGADPGSTKVQCEKKQEIQF